MSYILDALKKIEHEKSKITLPGGRISISGALFHDRKHPAARAAIWKVVLLIAVASAVTFTGTWFVLHGDGTEKVAVIPQVTPSQPPAPAIHPVATAPVVVPLQLQPAPVTVPTAAPSSAAPPVGISTQETGTDDDTSARSARRRKKRIQSEIPSPAQPSQLVTAPADIKLSGIAWQDERSARRAVVNGFLFKEGAVVSGAKITEIRADKVRFKSDAGPFEIKLDAALPVEVKK